MLDNYKKLGNINCRCKKGGKLWKGSFVNMRGSPFYRTYS